MAGIRSLGHVITQFLLNNCRLCSPASEHALFAAVMYAGAATKYSGVDPEAHIVPLTTGSAAEFYIEPMLSCIGDVDMMYHLSTMLAIPAGHPPPTQLPTDFHSYVILWKIIDSEWPGYVYLRLYGLLSQSKDDETYTFWHSEEQGYAVYARNDVFRTLRGPAVTGVFSVRSTSRPVTDDPQSIDIVRCCPCLVWPTQAADWPTRHRKYGWPDSANVDRVVSNGCDVVCVAHHHCKQNEWASDFQWRLSFSRAEAVLLNSWMPVQQIVYHMLRVFMKTERLTDIADDSGAKILSNYHIKTLMLWACELKPRDWWTDDLNCVRICTTLLHTLAAWIRDAQCMQYFVKGCNLFDQKRPYVAGRRLVCKLKSLTENLLSTWFVDNYIRKCGTLCGVINQNMKLETALSVIVHWRENTWRGECFAACENSAYRIVWNMDLYSRFRVTARSMRLCLRELAKVDQRLFVYFIAVAFLHVARLLANSEQRCCEFADVLATLCLYLNGRGGEYCRIPEDVSQLFNTATSFIKLAAKKPLDTLSLIQIKLSKNYLRKVLEYQNPALRPDNNSLLCLSSVYLAALYYTTGQYQTAADHCALATRTNDHTQSCSHVVEAELLPKIDDDIDNVLGLAAFYQYVRTAATKSSQRTQCASVLDAKLFARYLQVICIMPDPYQIRFIQKLSTFDSVWQYKRFAAGLKEMFVTDVLLLKMLFKHLAQRQRVKKIRPTGYNVPDLSHLLLQSAVEQLTTFRQLEAQRFGSVATIVTTDFEALYAYRCGEYQHCLQLCRQNVRTLIDAVTMSHVFTFSEFVQLMDDDIVSLVGLTLTVNPRSRDKDTNMRAVYVSQQTLSLYLLTQCQLKLRDSEAALRLTLSFIKLAQQKHPGNRTLDHLALRFTERKLVLMLRRARFIDNRYITA